MIIKFSVVGIVGYNRCFVHRRARAHTLYVRIKYARAIACNPAIQSQVKCDE